MLTETVKGGAVERTAAVAFVAENVFVPHLLPASDEVCAETVKLLFDGAGL
jgi:hypothetical protein